MPGTSPHRIVVLGGGSIGKRHAANLRLLGQENLAMVEPDPVRRAVLEKDMEVETFPDIDVAIAAFRPTIVFVCSPTKEHVPQALLAVQANADVFIEKPLSAGMEGVVELERAAAGRVTMVGCNMRFHPGPRKVQELVEAGAIGGVTHARFHTASYLPDWRPQTDYKKSYSADPLQGGVILDCIHEIDLALWICGAATLESATVTPATGIGLTVDGEAVIRLLHAGNVRSDVSMSFVTKGYERGCVIEGEQGRICWEYGKDVRLEERDGRVRETFPEPPGYESNQMYVDEIAYFLECVENRSPTFCGLREGKAALAIALAARHCT